MELRLLAQLWQTQTGSSLCATLWSSNRKRTAFTSVTSELRTSILVPVSKHLTFTIVTRMVGQSSMSRALNVS